MFETEPVTSPSNLSSSSGKSRNCCRSWGSHTNGNDQIWEVISRAFTVSLFPPSLTFSSSQPVPKKLKRRGGSLGLVGNRRNFSWGMPLGGAAEKEATCLRFLRLPNLLPKILPPWLHVDLYGHTCRPLEGEKVSGRLEFCTRRLNTKQKVAISGVAACVTSLYPNKEQPSDW